MKRETETVEKRTCLLVLGMHRSGTSALTRVLNIAGAALPKRLMGAAENSNATGHWEPDALIAYHDRMLAEMDSSWHDWRALDMSRLSVKRREEIRQEIGEVIAADYDDAPLVVLKDPRICRFAPFFFDVLRDAKVGASPVIAFRNPLEVCESLEKRDGMRRADAALLWLRHVLDAEKATRGMKRAFVGYDHFLENWKADIASLARQLNVNDFYTIDEIEPQVEGFLSGAHRHHAHKTQDVLLDPLLADWVGVAYQALLVLARNPNSTKAADQLDAIAGQFNSASPVLHNYYGEVRKEREGEIGVLSGEVTTLKEVLSETKVTASALALTLSERENETASVKEALSVAEGKTSELTAALDEREQETVNLRQALSDAEGKASELVSVLAGREQETLNLRQTLSGAEGKTSELVSVLAEREQETANLRQALSNAKIQKSELETRLSQTEGEASQLEATLGQRGVELGELKKSLAEQEAETSLLKAKQKKAEGKASELTAALDEREQETANLRQALSNAKSQKSELETRLSQTEGEASQLEATLGQRGVELGELKKSLAEREAETSSLKAKQKEVEGKASELTNELLHQRRQTSGAKSALTKQKNKTENLAEMLSQADGKAAELETRLLQAEGEASQLEESLAERGVEIEAINTARVEQEVSIREMEEAFAQEKEVLSGQLQEKEVALGEGQGKAQGLEVELSTIRQDLQQTQEGLAFAKKESEAYRNSTSWKVTKPLRAIGGPVKRFKKGPARIVSAVRTIKRGIILAGGLAPAVKKVRRILRQEGVSGLKWRWKHVSGWGNKQANKYNFVNYRISERKKTLSSPWHISYAEKKSTSITIYNSTITVSVVSHNSERWLDGFVKSLWKQSFPLKLINLVFVDHESQDGTLNFLLDYKNNNRDTFNSIIIIKQKNIGFGGGHNAAIRRSKDDFVLVTNLDLEFHADSIAQIVSFAACDDQDIASWELRQCPYEHPKYYDPVTLETSWSSHACILIRRSAYKAVGGYEERIFMYGEDVELSYRFRGAGFRLRYCPSASVTHFVDLDNETLRPHQLSGSISANLLLRYRYGSHEEIAEGEELVTSLLVGEKTQKRFAALHSAQDSVKLNREYFAGVRVPSHSVPFPFSHFDYDICRDGHDFEHTPTISEKNQPLVTIITRTHGQGVNCLREAMASVINQTYPNIEHIIVEDRTSFAHQLVEEVSIVYRDSNIRYLKSDGVGRSRAGNCGFAAAKGNFLMLLDSDDLLFSDHVEVLVAQLMKNNDAVAAYALGWEALIKVVNNGSSYHEIYHQVPAANRLPYSKNRLKHANFIPIQCMLFRHEVYEKMGGFHEDLDYLEDWNLWCRYSQVGNFLFIPKITSIYHTPLELVARLDRQKKLDASYEHVLFRNWQDSEQKVVHEKR